jgi:hypothetical protein
MTTIGDSVLAEYITQGGNGLMAKKKSKKSDKKKK